MGTKIKHEKIRRKQTTGEEIANAITHGIMVLFAIAIMVVLLTRSHYQAIKIFSAIVFGVSMIVLYINSCLYHSLTNNTAKNKVFRRLDHVSIYLLIGGTYAPILLTLDTLQTPLFAGSLSIGISTFIAQWVLIAVGITCKCVFFKKYH
jgi:hemolysin III